VCDYYHNRTAPEPGPHNITDYQFLSSDRCDYGIERCALVIDLWRPDGSHVSTCADMLVLTHETDQRIQIAVTPPSGTSPPSVSTFLSRLYDNYGTAGTKKQLGLSPANVRVDVTEFRARGDGSYTATFIVSDYLDVSVSANGQRTFQGYYSAGVAAQTLITEPLDGTGVGAVTPGATLVTATEIGGGIGPKPSSPSNKAGVVIGIILIILVGGVLLIFLIARFCFPEAYKKMTQPCPKKTTTQTDVQH